MRFETTQRYRSTPAEVIGAYADSALYPALVGLPMLGDIAVLDRSERDGRVQLRVRFRYVGDLPPGASAIIDPAKLTWVQETDHDLTSGRIAFRLVPDHYPDRLQANGDLAITADDSGATRTLTAELKVRAALVAGRVERALVGGLEEYLAAEAPRVDDFVERR